MNLMRLFIKKCKNCGQKIYLNVFAHTREELRRKIGDPFEVKCNHCGHIDTYWADGVYAEEGPPSLPAGAIIGGLIGLLGGPLGLIIGGGLGALLGANADENEGRMVRGFNRSG